MREGYGASQPKCGHETTNERELTLILQGGEEGAQRFEPLDPGHHFPQGGEGRRDVIQKIGRVP